MSVAVGAVSPPNVIITSSNVTVVALTVVVVPLIIKLPPTVKSDPTCNAPPIPTPPVTTNAPVVDELEIQKRIKVDYNNAEHLMFVVDYSVFRYENKGGGTIPRNLEYRLRNLIIKYGGV